MPFVSVTEREREPKSFSREECEGMFVRRRRRRRRMGGWVDGWVWVEEWLVGWGGGGALDKGQGVKK